ncbi:MAG: hypothetical protein QNK37_27975 [Acidobacteriota bacterium]|nr:hypothetical protein [Acidobacteriota bacterium]
MNKVAVIILLLVSGVGMGWTQNPFEPERGEYNAPYVPETIEKTLIEANDETQAASMLREALVETAAVTGLKLNSISNRKTKVLDEDTGLMELRIYLGYDANLDNLLAFFEGLAMHDLEFTVDTLNVSARRRPRTVGKGDAAEHTSRPPLNGNCVLSALYDPQGVHAPWPKGYERRFSLQGLPVRIIWELGRNLEADTYLTNLQIKKGSMLQLQGKSECVDGLLQALKGIDLFTDFEDGATGLSKRPDRFLFKMKLTEEL